MAAAKTLHVLAAVTLACVPAVACGSAGDASDAGADQQYGHKPVDAGFADDGDAEAEAKSPWNRMEPHSDVVLASPHVWAIYIGPGWSGGTSTAFDTYLTWLVGSTDYWSILAQYGVGYGTFDGSSLVDTTVFFTPGMINNVGMVSWSALEARVSQVINQAASDAGAADSGDAGDAGLSAIPLGETYIIFLPDNVNVDLGQGEVTCAGVGGYHSYDGTESYAVIPPCGHHGLVISHEMAEMVTDPVPGLGWFSDQDVQNAGGEVGDLCNFLVQPDGNQATALWSNKDGDCEPAQ